MSVRNYSNTAAQSTLSASIAATDTSISLTGYSGDPTPPFTAALARGTANEEVVLVTAVVGSTVTVTRAYDGTTAKAQSAGATFQEVVAALDFREANTHVNSGASGAHGTTSQVVGVSDTQTLTNKTLTTPTITSPTITGTATIATGTVTTLNVSGVSSLAGGTASGAFTFTGLITANGGVSATTLAASGNATVGGTLAVTGNATASGTLGVAGVLTGAGLVSTVGLTLAQIGAPAGVASKGQVWSQSDGGLYTRAGATNPAARLPVHWGSGATFPTVGLIVGDLFYRSDLGATFRWLTGTTWEQSGTPAYATAAARDAVYTAGVKPNIPDGFVIWHSGLKCEQRWDATNTRWRFRLYGLPSGLAADVNGLTTIAHGAGQAPTAWGTEPASSATDAQNAVIKPLVWSTDATNLTVRWVRTDTSTYYVSQTGLSCAWWASF